MAGAHAAAIEMYLTEKLRTLEMLAGTNTLEELVTADSFSKEPHQLSLCRPPPTTQLYNKHDSQDR